MATYKFPEIFIVDVLQHITAFDKSIISIVNNNAGAYLITIDGTIPESQTAHLFDNYSFVEETT